MFISYRCDILCLNAGIAGTSGEIRTEDDLELTMATNHFGHFLLVHLLSGIIIYHFNSLFHLFFCKDLIQKSKEPSRIVVTSSVMHMTAMSIDMKHITFRQGGLMLLSSAYRMSKLYNVMMTKYLAKYFQGKGNK